MTPPRRAPAAPLRLRLRSATAARRGNSYDIQTRKPDSRWGQIKPPDRGHCKPPRRLGEPLDWLIEVKLARVGRDNGTYEDTAVKKILSPYPDDRSAVTDCVKLANSGFDARRAVLIYGFEDQSRPPRWLIDAFELIASPHATLGQRVEAALDGLVHPIFASGAVFAWEVYVD